MGTELEPPNWTLNADMNEHLQAEASALQHSAAQENCSRVISGVHGNRILTNPSTATHPLLQNPIAIDSPYVKKANLPSPIAIPPLKRLCARH